MIISFFYIIAGDIVALFAYPLSFLPFHFPTEIYDAFVTFFNVLHTFADFLPFISAIVAIILVLLPAKYIRLTVDILLWIFSIIPFIGKSVRGPLEGHSLDLRSHSVSRGTLDLRRGKVAGHRSRRTVSDITRGT